MSKDGAMLSSSLISPPNGASPIEVDDSEAAPGEPEALEKARRPPWKGNLFRNLDKPDGSTECAYGALRRLHRKIIDEHSSTCVSVTALQKRLRWQGSRIVTNALMHTWLVKIW